MLNVHDLERRWLKYKIKSYLPHFSLATALVTAAVLLFFYLPKMDNTEEIVKNTEDKKAVLPKETLPVETDSDIKRKGTQELQTPLEVPQNTQKQEVQQSSNMVLKPSLHFMDNIEDTLNPYMEMDDKEQLEQGSLLESSNERIESPSEKPIENVQEGLPPKEKKRMLTIKKNEDESDLKDVIRRFKKNKNPALSLFIAKRYYALEQYQKSYNYALITNEIDKNIDESWIIFSKSLVKLGQHELATLTLKTYLKNSKSTQAEILLRKIEAGDFR